jgi:hypothetical protein
MSRSRLSTVGLLVAFLAAAAAVGLLAGLWGYNRGQATRITDTGPAVVRLEKLSELATVKVHVADVLTAENTSWFGDIKGAWLIKGDALISVDMKLAKVLSTNGEKKVIRVLLPRPRVIQPRVDHNKTVAYDWRKGWLRSSDVAAIVWKEAMLHAQELVEQLAAEPDQIDLAREQAQTALKQVYANVGWDLEVVWEDKAGAASRP